MAEIIRFDLFIKAKNSYFDGMIEIPAQPKMAEIFERLIRGNRLASSYLFYGPAGSGKWQAAIEVAAAVFPDDSTANRVKKLIHPDLQLIFPLPATPKTDKGFQQKQEHIDHFKSAKRANPYARVGFDKVSSIHVEDIKEMQANLYKTSVEGGYRIAIIEKAEAMLPSSFDTMLKTIEEPPPGSLIMLLTDNFERLPETIRSRCQNIRFRRLGREFIVDYLVKQKSLDRENAKFISSLSFGSIDRAEKLLDSEFFDERETAIMLLGYLLSHPLESFWTEFLGLVNLRDQSKIENLLIIWQSLYHDICILTSDVGTEKIINNDQQKSLQKLANLVGGFENAQNGLKNLLALQRLFYRNLNPLTAFYDIASRLKANQPPMVIRG